MILVHLFVYFVRVSFVMFLFLVVSGVGCGLLLWHSLDFSINLLFNPPVALCTGTRDKVHMVGGR